MIHHVEGPPTAYFYCGEEKHAYVTYAQSDDCSMEKYLLWMAQEFSEHEVIVWRILPYKTEAGRSICRFVGISFEEAININRFSAQELKIMRDERSFDETLLDDGQLFRLQEIKVTDEKVVAALCDIQGIQKVA